MPDVEIIADDEYILRHIPPGDTWIGPGPSVTSANFKLRRDRQEIGISVSRLSITSLADLLRHVGGDPQGGSRIAKALVRPIRALGLEVIHWPLPHDTGHAEIRSGSASLQSRGVRRDLADLFEFVEAE